MKVEIYLSSGQTITLTGLASYELSLNPKVQRFKWVTKNNSKQILKMINVEEIVAVVQID